MPTSPLPCLARRPPVALPAPVTSLTPGLLQLLKSPDPTWRPLPPLPPGDGAQAAAEAGNEGRGALSGRDASTAAAARGARNAGIQAGRGEGRTARKRPAGYCRTRLLSRVRSSRARLPSAPRARLTSSAIPKDCLPGMRRRTDMDTETVSLSHTRGGDFTPLCDSCAHRHPARQPGLASQPFLPKGMPCFRRSPAPQASARNTFYGRKRELCRPKDPTRI